MSKHPWIALPLIALLAGGGQVNAQTAPADPRVADIAQAGVLRAGLFLTQYAKHPTSGELSSVWVETARALAARIGARAVLIEHPTPQAAVQCLRSGACDVIFLPRDARAANDGDFSAPFIQFEYTLLVPAGSTIRSIADADRAEVRIAAVRNHASAVTLAQRLKQAQLVTADTPDPVFDMLRKGETHAMASARNTLITYSNKLAGSRVLEDFYGANLNRIVVPKGNAGRLAFVNAFVEQAKASGQLRGFIDRVGPRGITVAPAGDAQ